MKIGLRGLAWAGKCSAVFLLLFGSFLCPTSELVAQRAEKGTENGTQNGAASPDGPNVVLIVVDDLGATDLGCYGSEFYETPRIDSLARRSMRFTSFYSGHPVCSPTRASLMTGKAPQRVGITDWIPQPSDIHLPLAERTLAECFQEAGYATGFIGKWHLGEQDEQLPTGHGYDWQRCVNRAGQPGSYFFPFKRKTAKGQAYWDVPDLDDRSPGDYLTDEMTDQALGFLDENRSKPFFLTLAYYSVHTPMQAPPKIVKKYREKRSSLYGESNTPSRVELNGAKTRLRQDNPTYAAMVEMMDRNVGRILDRLETLKLTGSTIVVFTSDNGGLSTLKNRSGPTSVAPFRAGKGWNYEGGIRVPTMISWPPTIASGETDTAGITMDLFPTLLELAGLELLPNQHRDGLSLVPLLQGEMQGKTPSKFAERALVWHYPHPHGSGHRPSSAIRVGDWKLVSRNEGSEIELYDLSKDVGEHSDLSKEKPGIAARLRTRLDRELKSQVR